MKMTIAHNGKMPCPGSIWPCREYMLGQLNFFCFADGGVVYPVIFPLAILSKLKLCGFILKSSKAHIKQKDSFHGTVGESES